MEKQSVKRKSIVHALNVFLTTPVNIFVNRETGAYVIGYEPKTYRVHYLVYKISKELVNKVENPIKISTAVDLNVREEFRYNIKFSDPDSRINGKNVTIRIVPTRYDTISPLYAIFYQFQWRKTGAGGLDEIQFKIPECPTIVNGNVVSNICYKKVASQRSFGGTHGTYTFIIISPQRGQHTVGEWIHMGNVTKGGHHHGETRPVIVSL